MWSFRWFKSYFGFLSKTFCSFFNYYSLSTYMVRSICVDPIANIVYVSSSTQFEFARDASKSTNLEILFFSLPHNLSDILLRSLFSLTARTIVGISFPLHWLFSTFLVNVQCNLQLMSFIILLMLLFLFTAALDILLSRLL